MNSLSVSKKFIASVAHRYWQPAWSEAENLRIYGRDAHIEGIGSNMEVECVLAGDENLHESFLLAPSAEIKSLIDHRCFFDSGHALADRASTLEVITIYLAQHLFAIVPKHGQWQQLRVRESAYLQCFCGADGSFGLRLKVLNLTLTVEGAIDAKSGLLISRDACEKAVRAVFFTHQAEHDLERWGSGLFSDLKAHLPLLTELQVDLPRQECLILSETRTIPKNQ